MVGAGCRRKASCNPARLAKSGGRVSKAAKPGAEQPGATHSPQGEHGEDCEHPPFDTALGAAPQLNKPTSGRQARPPKGGSGALLGQSFYVHKNISGYPLRGARSHTRCMATYKCALRENGRTLFALVVSLKMRDLHSLVSQVELLLSPIGVAVFLHKPNAVAVEKQRGIYPIEVRVGALCDEPFLMSSRMAL